MPSAEIGKRLTHAVDLYNERQLLLECLRADLKVTYEPFEGRECVVVEHWLDRAILFSGRPGPCFFNAGKGENLALALYSFLLHNPEFGAEDSGVGTPEFRQKHLTPEVAATCTCNQGIWWDNAEEGKPLRCACCGQ